MKQSLSHRDLQHDDDDDDDDDNYHKNVLNIASMNYDSYAQFSSNTKNVRFV